MYRLFAYPDSSDLYDIEEQLLLAFDEFACSWPVEGVLLTNKKAPLMEGQELPDWNLGLRVETEHLTRSNIEELLSFVSDLSRSGGPDHGGRLCGLTGRIWTPLQRQEPDRGCWLEGAPAVVYPASGVDLLGPCQHGICGGGSANRSERLLGSQTC